MINKQLILSLVFMFGFIGFSFAQVNLNPIYSPDRFQPSDRFHAGCENHIDVVFDLAEGTINGVNAIVKYDNQDITILKVLPQLEQENNLSYVVEDDQIVFNKLKTDSKGLDKVVFQLFFLGKSSLKRTEFSFVTGSYIVDQDGNMIDLVGGYEFMFIDVPECNPDIISPSIDIIFPILGTGEYVSLDSYFSFDISDQGKGIHKDSLEITIDDVKYDLSNIEHEWSGTQLKVYPDIRLPLGEDVELEIQVADKQVYGKANLTHKNYVLQTSTGLNLLNEIDPVQFRKLVNKEKYYQGSELECELLNDSYLDMDEKGQEIIRSINKRLSCPEIENNLEIIVDVLDMEEESVKYSVFAVLGWILFGLLFVIKLFGWFAKGHNKIEE